MFYLRLYLNFKLLKYKTLITVILCKQEIFRNKVRAGDMKAYSVRYEDHKKSHQRLMAFRLNAQRATCRLVHEAVQRFRPAADHSAVENVAGAASRRLAVWRCHSCHFA